jgi:hypothetical protein
MSDELKKVKLAAIAGASMALRYRDKNPHASEQEIMQHVSSNMRELVSNLDKQD